MNKKNILAAGSQLFRENPLSILFVTSQLRPRELKMAHGLRQIGWKVVLIYNKWTPFESDEFFDLSIEASTANEAHAYAVEFSPKICHIFSGAIDDWVMAFCRFKAAPVVIDLNDVFAPSLFDYCHERFEPTKEALALADGFCARDLQVKIAEKLDNFSLPRHTIFFPEYCWNSAPIPEKSAHELLDDEVRVVSVGTFSLESQGMFDSCYLQLANMFVEQKIHFHIYPHWSYRKDHKGSPHANLKKDFADFLALEKSSQYLHVHDSLPIDELMKVLPQYDFGLISGGCAQFGQKLKFYKPEYIQTCYSGRITDYLDAELPVLINDEVAFDFWLLKRYGMCIDIKEIFHPGFKQKLFSLKRDRKTQKQAATARKILSIDENAQRLGKFYSQIISENLTFKAKPITETPVRQLSRQTEHSTVRVWLYRLGRFFLPYRAIRRLEIALHTAKQNNASLLAENIEFQSKLETEQLLVHRLEEENSVFKIDNSNLLLEITALESKFKTELVEQERLLFGGEENLSIKNENDHLLVESRVFQTKRKAQLIQQLIQIEELEENIRELQEYNSSLISQNDDLNEQLNTLANEKFLMQQETKWGALSLNDLAGVLNWPEVLNDLERTNGFSELVRILRLYSSSLSSLDRSSACWEILNIKNLDQLLVAGYSNFKRTIGLNYFNFLVQKNDPQLVALESILAAEECSRCWEIASSIQDDPDLQCPDQCTYRYFVLLLWTYLQRVDKKGYSNLLNEPPEGNPLYVSFGDQQITQDLANSILEYYSMSECIQFENVSRVLEIGGGYGRDAYVMLALNTNIKMTLVDIPPALYLAQRYLSSVFKNRRVFYVREFTSYDEVKDEIENASIVLLMPHQLSLLPDAYFEVSYNISSFGEMSQDQINQYFEQLERLTSKFFYTKQWEKSTNSFDGLVLEEKDYPFSKRWTKLYSRTCPVQSEFFETLYRTGGNGGE